MFLTLIPFYLLSNLHCAGMCGPLVMLLAQNRGIWLYFVGRIVGFTLIASAVQALGLLISGFILPTLLCFLASSFIIVMGICMLFHLHSRRLAFVSGFVSERFTQLILINKPHATLLFGLCTPLLPCGQSMIVFSAAAISTSLSAASLQGCSFALATTPGLLCALFFSNIFRKIKTKSPSLLAYATITVGIALFLRALADLNLIDHLIISRTYHLVLY